MNRICEFEGKILEVDYKSQIPKRVVCPTCKRRMLTKIVTCGCALCYEDLDWACYIYICVPRHKIKKWWKK